MNILILAERYYDMCSLSESAALKLANASPEEFVNHNKRFLSRIYPNSMRVDSSNYNPQDLWNCGCQLGEGGMPSMKLHDVMQENVDGNNLWQGKAAVL